MSSLFRTFSPTRADCPSRWTARPSVLLLPVAPNLRLTKPSHKQRSTLSSRSNQDQLSSSGRVKCFAAMHRSVTGAWEGVAFLGLEIELAPGVPRWTGERWCLSADSPRSVKRFTNSRLKRTVARPSRRAGISPQFHRRGDWRGQPSETKVAALGSSAFRVVDHGRDSCCSIELRSTLPRQQDRNQNPLRPTPPLRRALERSHFAAGLHSVSRHRPQVSRRRPESPRRKKTHLRPDRRASG